MGSPGELIEAKKVRLASDGFRRLPTASDGFRRLPAASPPVEAAGRRGRPSPVRKRHLRTKTREKPNKRVSRTVGDDAEGTFHAQMVRPDPKTAR
jgi:hypothetical protein